MPRRRMPKLAPGQKLAAPVRANAGVAAAYRRKLLALIGDMHNSVLYWTKAQWRKDTPELAQDKSPARSLQSSLQKQLKRWRREFDGRAEAIAKWLSEQTDLHATNALRKSLADAMGMTVPMRMTPAVRDVLDSIIAENVNLIRSIPEQYFTDVQGFVMRSVQEGRDLASLTDDIEERYGVTRSRAELIARDQNNKATESINRVRQQDLGITKAVWIHAGAGKHPRESHVAADGKEYDLDKGLKIDGEFIFPGQLINCRCVSSPVIAAFAE